MKRTLRAGDVCLVYGDPAVPTLVLEVVPLDRRPWKCRRIYPDGDTGSLHGHKRDALVLIERDGEPISDEIETHRMTARPPLLVDRRR